MSTHTASPQIKPQSPLGGNSNQPVKKQATTTAAQQLVEIITSSTQPNRVRGPVGRRIRQFERAYSSLVATLEPQNGLEILLEMNEAIAKTIDATRITESQPTLTKPSKAQQENDAFMADLRKQEQTLRARDIASKKLLTSAEIRKRLDITPQALSAAVKAKRMFALTGPSGGSYYPAFFADHKYDRRDLEKVSKALAGLSGGSKWGFFTTPRISLGNKTPLEALAKGKLDLVLVAAAGFMEE